MGWGGKYHISYKGVEWKRVLEREREILKKLCRVKAMLGKYEGPLKCGGCVIH